MRVLLDEISIWMGGLSKIACPPQCEWAQSIVLKAFIEKDRARGRKSSPLFCFLSVWAETSVFSCPWIGIYNTGSPGSVSGGESRDPFFHGPQFLVRKQRRIWGLSCCKRVYWRLGKREQREYLKTEREEARPRKAKALDECRDFKARLFA